MDSGALSAFRVSVVPLPLHHEAGHASKAVGSVRNRGGEADETNPESESRREDDSNTNCRESLDRFAHIANDAFPSFRETGWLHNRIEKVDTAGLRCNT